MGAEARYRISAEDRSKAALDSFRKNIIGIDSAMGGLKTRIATVVSGVAIGAFIKSAADSADQVWNLHQRLGMTTESLGELRHVAGLSGTQFETVAKSVQKLSQNTGEALRGNVALGKVFKELHLDLRNFGALAPEQQFETLADRLMAVDNEGKRVSFAIDLMGRSGAEMLQVMAEGSDGIRQMREEAEALGVSLDERSTKALADANDAMDRMKTAGTALGTTLASLAAGPIEDLSVGVIKAVGHFREWIEGITSSTLDRAISRMEDLGATIEDINRMTARRDLIDLEEKLASATAAAAPALVKLAEAAGDVEAGVSKINWAMRAYTADIPGAVSAQKQLTAALERQEQTPDVFLQAQLGVDRLLRSMRELANVEDPMNTEHLLTALNLQGRVNALMEDAYRMLRDGEIGEEVYGRLSDRLDEYKVGLDGYVRTLEEIVRLERLRGLLSDTAETGRKPQAGGGGWSAEIPGMEVPFAEAYLGDRGRGKGGDFEKLAEPDFLAPLLDQTDGLHEITDALAETQAGADMLAMGLEALSEVGGVAMSNFIDASIAALQGSKGAYGEMGKVMLKWSADTLKALAATAAGKAIYYLAEGWAWSSLGQADKAKDAFLAAGMYGTMAAYTAPAAILVGAASANNAPSGAFMSQEERESSTGLAGGRKTIGGSTTSTALASSPTTIYVPHLYYGNVYYGSQAQSDARSIQEQLDAGTLYVKEGVA